MKSTIQKIGFFLSLFFIFSISSFSQTFQNTQIRGFIDGLITYQNGGRSYEGNITQQNGRISFGFGEQDLFITSELHDRVSFLGESVFKFTPSSPTDFSVSIERVIIKYNFSGNNNLLLGKIHSPLNYWNDTYHHGRLFYPTVGRPLLFDANIIPLHTTGVGVQGHDLGNINFGYDFFVGNGLGSEDVIDNDQNKSISTAIHIKPVDGLRIGVSYYYDIVSKGAIVHTQPKPINWQVNQQLFSGSVAYFGKKFELLAESTFGINHTDTTGSKQTSASYLYGGYRITNKITPYFRYDNLHYQEGEIYYIKDNTTSFVAGIRYQINYLAVIKFECQFQHSEVYGKTEVGTFQFAIGF